MAGPNIYFQITHKGHADPGAEAIVRNIFNVYTYKRTAPASSVSKANVIAAFRTSLITPLMQVLSVAYISDFVQGRFIDDSFDPYLTIPITTAGTVAGDNLPSLMNVTVQMQTGIRGRPYRGSKHYGPIAVAHSLKNSLNATALTAWGVFLPLFLAGFTDSDGNVFKPCVIQSKGTKYTGASPVINATVVNFMKVNSSLKEMERREA